MLARCLFAGGLTLSTMVTIADSASPNGVRTLDPPGAVITGGDTWSVGARAGDFIFVAGMQGVDPVTKKLVDGDEARIRQAFLNLKLIAQSEGATLQDCVRITVYVSDLQRLAPLVSKVQAELWGNPPYPPRTMLEVQRLFDDDIIEIDSIFYFTSEELNCVERMELYMKGYRRRDQSRQSRSTSRVWGEVSRLISCRRRGANRRPVHLHWKFATRKPIP
jgi:2-iminobutanoate/2-iminopropanoate deaminase